MDRLTKKDVNGGNIIFTRDEWCYDPKDNVLTVRGSIADKLAAYEDTGLTPAEIEQLKAENKMLKKQAREIDSNAASVQREYRAEIKQLKAENERLHKLVNPELLERSKNDGGRHQSNVARKTH